MKYYKLGNRENYTLKYRLFLDIN